MKGLNIRTNIIRLISFSPNALIGVARSRVSLDLWQSTLSVHNLAALISGCGGVFGETSQLVIPETYRSERIRIMLLQDLINRKRAARACAFAQISNSIQSLGRRMS